jgi:hypothetical protein
MSRGVYIIGRRNVVNADASGIVLINCEGVTATYEDNDTTNINSGALIVDANGVTELTPAPKRLGITGGSTVTVGNAEAIYFCDATAGNINITIEHTDIPKTFVRLDASVNTVTITPDSGLINGAASLGLNTQYEKITILSYASNFYY